MTWYNWKRWALCTIQFIWSSRIGIAIPIGLLGENVNDKATFCMSEHSNDEQREVLGNRGMMLQHLYCVIHCFRPLTIHTFFNVDSIDNNRYGRCVIRSSSEMCCPYNNCWEPIPLVISPHLNWSKNATRAEIWWQIDDRACVKQLSACNLLR